MSTYATDRPIELAQLSEALGTHALSMSDDGATRTITCHDESVTQEQLEAAIEAHVPAPPTPSTASLLQAQLDELTDFVAELSILLEGNV